jgi:hypothetical protein
MKKIIFLLSVVFAIVSCKTETEKEEPKNPYEQTVIVEVFFLDSNGIETAPIGNNASTVWIFEDADFNLSYTSEFSMRETPQRMTLNDSTEVDYKFRNPQDWQRGIYRHIFKNVPDGEYFIVISCLVQIDDVAYERAFRRITVNEHMHEVVQKIVFTDADNWFFNFPPFWFVEK